MKVSIILPVCNGAKFIRKAIGSVLAQSFLDWELIIINDGSIDDTENIVKEYINKNSKVIYLKNEKNLGLQKTLNIGLKEAKGEYIARIDSDDEWVDKNKLEKQISFLDENSEYVLVGTGAIIINEKNQELFRYLFPEKDKQIRDKILYKNYFIHSSVLFRKDTALKAGGYSEKKEFQHIEDYDLWLRLGLFGKFYDLPIYAVKFTLRKGSISSDNKLDQLKKGLKLLKEYKNLYPKYFQAFIFRKSVIYFYEFFKFLPFYSFKNKLIKIYKSF